MASTSVGQQAEARVADYLIENGFKILNANWRTRWCEIDVIAQKDKIVYFIEVKYRLNQTHGTGFEYITRHKLSQIRFATKFWTAQNNWEGDCRLIAAEVSGLDFSHINLTEID
jgi:uncharacterized protein (TIGR00252 family)